MMNFTGPLKNRWLWVAVSLTLLLQPGLSMAAEQAAAGQLLQPDSYRHYFAEFVQDEKEMLGDAPPLPWDWFVENIP
jgi:hypothetical protein